MAIKTCYQVEVGGKPQRFVNHAGKLVSVVAGIGLDGPDQFSSPERAQQKAKRAGLTDYTVTPVQRDIGTPTNLTEIGL